MAGRIAGRILGRIAGKVKLITGKLAGRIAALMPDQRREVPREGQKLPKRIRKNRKVAGQQLHQQQTTIAGETRYTVIEPRSLETNSTEESDSRRSMPIQIFPDDSQLPDLGISGDSNLWHDGYS